MRPSMLLLFLTLSFAPSLLADEGQHHEELSAEQLGTVHFPVSCAASVQKPFERGVALLHSFWYEEAEKAFQQIAKDDPKCAMAHWGIAVSLWHQLWDHPKAGTVAQGLAEVKKAKSLHPKTERERDYIKAMSTFYDHSNTVDHHARAVAYSAAMEKLYQRNPGDREAAAFYGLSLLASEPENDSSFANRRKAVEVLEKVFAQEPNHPGVAHYIIHSCDKPQLAELGLPAARRYAQIAPAAPHALHMPSHIFARVGLWQDDIDSNVASIAATRKTAAMHMGGEAHQFHAMDFLVYAYLQSGHDAEAQHVIEETKTMPRMKSDKYGEYDAHAYVLAQFPAMYELELHHWTEAAALIPVAGSDKGTEAITYWARSIGAVRSGNLVQARKDLEEMDGIHRSLVADKKTFEAKLVDKGHQEATAWLWHAEGKDDQAIASLRALADEDDKLGDEPTAIPAREMLADLLLELKRPEQALAEYQIDLRFNPNRFNGLYGAARAAEMAGKTDKANDYYAQLVKACAGSNSDRPELARAKSLIAQK